MGLSRGRASIRVLQVSRGRPLTSAEQEPHLPALQFQRTARSGAWCAWIWWSASSTTMPGAIGTRYVAGCPPSRSPRNTSKIASAIAPPLFVAPPPRRLSGERLAHRAEGETPSGQPAGCRRYQNQLFFFRNKLLQVCGHFGHRGLAKGHFASLADDYIIFRSPDWVEAWMINPAMSAAALFTRQCAA